MCRHPITASKYFQDKPRQFCSGGYSPTHCSGVLPSSRHAGGDSGAIGQLNVTSALLHLLNDGLGTRTSFPLGLIAIVIRCIPVELSAVGALEPVQRVPPPGLSAKLVPAAQAEGGHETKEACPG
jgi:hypothetical protein